MALLRNGIYGYRTIGPVGFLGSLPSYWRNFASNTLTWQNTGGDASARERVAFPSGTARSAFHKPLKDGGIRVLITGGSNLVAGIEGPADLTATLTGGGTIVPPTLFSARSMQATVTGGGNITTAQIGAIANMQCVIRIGAYPSAFDNAQAVLNAIAADYNIAGTVGAKINSAGSGGAVPMLNTETGDVIIPLE